MPEFRYLPQPRITELFKALVDTGLATHRKLDDLNADMNRHFVASLDTDGAPLDRLLRTLAELNRVERLADGSVPLAQWLGAAEPRMISSEEGAKVVQAALNDVLRGGVKAPDVQAPPVPAGFEQTKDLTRTDMLPFAFLTQGARVGRSVARLAVPRYEGGEPVIFKGKPKTYLGTGWLITPDLLVTNHHVVNARDDGTHAAEADLRLQAGKTQVQFDYENPDAAIESEAVTELAAWAPLDGPLDYAIVRLAQKQDATRPPLRLRREAMKLPADVAEYPALNIVQHPLGGPKMVAFRNNQVVQVMDGDLWYYTDTQRGSSGAPVLDDDWRVVALHKRWTWATGLKYQGKSASWVNVGTQIASILADLRAKESPVLGEILSQST
jgi:V8-like Glu-specific endopeptidase